MVSDSFILSFGFVPIFCWVLVGHLEVSTTQSLP